MSLSLSEYVSCGEILNTNKNSVQGYLLLRGCDRPVFLQLTGNFCAEMAGRHIRFEVRSDPAADMDPVTEEEMNQLRLGWTQIGVPGKMEIHSGSLTSEVSESPGFPKDDASSLSEPGLFLEWFSQNGRTVIELADPIITFIQGAHWFGNLEALGITIGPEDLVGYDPDEEDLDGELSDAAPDSLSTFDDPDDETEHEIWGDPSLEDIDGDNDPFGLFPKGLEADLNESLPAAAWGAEPDEETLQQWKEWDEIVDGTKDVPLSSLFDPPLKVLPVDSLDDQQVVCQLNLILSQLALHNVALRMCEHFTLRSAYKLLVETILPQGFTHPELPRIGFTMNFHTSESCDECAADAARYAAELEADENRKRLALDDDFENDVPF